MRLKIIESNMSNFTGEMSGVVFENGVSIDSVSQRDADRIGAILRCKYLENPEAPLGETERMATLRARSTAAPDVVGQITMREARGEEPTPEQPVATDQAVQEPSANEEAVERLKTNYTRATLESIADKGGINAIRAIGEPLGIRGREIDKLIDAILASQE